LVQCGEILKSKIFSPLAKFQVKSVLHLPVVSQQIGRVRVAGTLIASEQVLHAACRVQSAIFSFAASTQPPCSLDCRARQRPQRFLKFSPRAVLTISHPPCQFLLIHYPLDSDTSTFRQSRLRDESSSPMWDLSLLSRTLAHAASQPSLRGTRLDHLFIRRSTSGQL
jgi:hypothetical protein